MKIGLHISAFHVRTWHFIQGPTFLTVLRINNRWTIQHFTFAAIEAGQMAAARKRCPHYAILVDIETAWSESLHFAIDNRQFVDFSYASFRGVVADVHAVNSARKFSTNAPGHVVHRVHDNAVAAWAHAGIESWVNVAELLSPPTFVFTAKCTNGLIPGHSNAAVPISVYHHGAPTLRELFVTGKVILTSINPTYDITSATEIQHTILIEAKLQMVGAKTGINQSELFRGWIIVRSLAGAASGGIVLNIFVGRSFLAPLWQIVAAHLSGHPHTTQLIEHWVVWVRGPLPQWLIAIVSRRDWELLGESRHRRIVRIIFHCNHDLTPRIGFRIQLQQCTVSAIDTVNLSTGVDSWIAFVSSYFIVDVGGLITPVPLGNNDIAFNSTGAWRCRRNFTRCYSIGPVCIHFHAVGPETISETSHEGASDSHGNAISPCLDAGLEAEMAKVIQRASGLIAELVTELATLFCHVNPLFLATHTLGDTIAVRAGTGKLVCIRHF